MLKRALLVQLMLFGVLFCCIAQPKPNTYEPVISSGEIPKDMLIKSSKKYEVEKSTISKEDSRKDRKSKESFYLSTNFEIDKLLLSGMVSFNDPITVYLNKIVDVLLKDNPALRKQVRIYTMKSTSMNAFATNQGIIFVNLGLLAKLKNESELAFILAHEITHVEEKHALNKYLKVQTIKRDKNIYKDLSLDDKLANINHYSRELETEADEHGLELYLKAGYSLEALDGAFTGLSYAHQPFVEHEFDFEWLESSTFQFPQEFRRDKLNAIEPLEDDDTASTHPSVQLRRENIMAKVKDVSNEGRKVFVVSETQFKEALIFAQFEVCRLHLTRQYYNLAIYEAQALLKQYPDNLYLKKVIMKALGAMAYRSNDGIDLSSWEDYVNEDLQGNMQRAYHFFLSLSADADYIATVAARHSWLLHKQFPNDNEIASTADSLISLVFEGRGVEPGYYSYTPRPQTETDSILQEYDFAKNPDKKRLHDEMLDSLAIINALDSVMDEDTIAVKARDIKLDGLATTTRKKDVDTTVIEEGDTTLYTSVAEAKKNGVKLTGYEQYQLKNKAKYGIKGIKGNGTIVYNTDEDVVISPEDTIVYTTIEEAKKNGIKLSDYKKQQLKNKEKYNVKGVLKDGTIVYNEEEEEDDDNTDLRVQRPDSSRVASNGNNTNNSTTARSGNDSDTTGKGALVTKVENSDTAEIELPAAIYHHDFNKLIDEEFHKYAFVDFADDEEFKKKAKFFYRKSDEGQDDFNSASAKLKRNNERKQDKLNRKRGFALNIDKVVLVNPTYSKVNLANPDKQTYLTTEKNQQRFSRLLKTNANASGIGFQVLDSKNLKNKDINTYNDIAFLNEWLNERLEIGDYVPFSTLELSEREELAKKYGTRYFMWTGNLSVKEKDYAKAKLITYSIIIPPLLPFMLPRMVRGGKYQIYYYLVYDIVSNEMVMSDVIYSNQLERNDFLHSQVYYTFNQLKYKR